MSPLSLLGKCRPLIFALRRQLTSPMMSWQLVAVAIRGVIEGDRYPHAQRLDPLRAALASLDAASKPTKTAPPAKADKGARR
jgi:hypothetical protein